MGELGDRSSCTTLCEQWPNVQPDACVGNGLNPNLSLSRRELKVWEHPNVWVGERRRRRDKDHRMGTMARSMSQSQRSYHYPHGRDGCTDSWHWVGYRSLNPHTECLWCIVWWRVFPSAPLRSCMQQIPGGKLYVREMETNVRTISMTMNLGNKEDWILWSSAWTLEFESQLYPSQLYDCVQMKHTQPLLILKTGIIIPTHAIATIKWVNRCKVYRIMSCM